MCIHKKIFLVAAFIFLSGCASMTRPATVFDKEVDAKPVIVPADGTSSSAVYLQTQTHIYEAARIEHMITDTVIITPFPFWNVESTYVCIDDIISIAVPKKNNSGIGFVLGFSFGFSFVGISGLLESEYNCDYSRFLGLSTLSGILCGGIGACLGGSGNMSTPSNYDFRKMTPDERRRALYKIMIDQQ